MQRDEHLFLEDILNACRKIAEYTVAMTLEDFRSDSKTFDAVIRNLEIIGEGRPDQCSRSRGQLSLQRSEEIACTMDEGQDLDFRNAYAIEHSVLLAEYEQLADHRIADLRNDAAAIREVA